MDGATRKDGLGCDDAAELDRLLDEALRMTFPASDPISLRLEQPSRAEAADGSARIDAGPEMPCTEEKARSRP
jgi:hypothetical protein